jgi:hypothetical protein
MKVKFINPAVTVRGPYKTGDIDEFDDKYAKFLILERIAEQYEPPKAKKVKSDD